MDEIEIVGTALIIIILIGLGLLLGVSISQNEIDDIYDKQYTECIEKLPRNLDCKIESINFNVVNKESK